MYLWGWGCAFLFDFSEVVLVGAHGVEFLDTYLIMIRDFGELCGVRELGRDGGNIP